MAIDFETIKKIDANGTNVGMIRDSAGTILWRKKYDKLHIGLAEPYDVDVWEWKSVAEYAPNNVMTGTNVAVNNYFRYNDRVDIFEPINPNVNLNAKLVVSWPSDGAYSQLRDISLLEYRMTTYTASNAVNFNYPVHAKGIARELGRIENQDSWYADASDTIACVSSDITREHPEST